VAWHVSQMPRQFAPDPALATVLRRLRVERGATQEALAFRSGITTGSLARIELGQASPAWTTVRQIATALDVSLVEIAAAVEGS
jgi:transcriptional regulator with XRE-family HTH domain